MSQKLLQNYLKKWSLENPVHLTNTATAYLYHVDSRFGPAVLKIFTELGIKDESSGTDYLKACAGEGVVKLFAADEGAQLLELLHGEGFSKYNDQNASEIFVGILRNTFTCQNIAPNHKLRSLESLLNVFERIKTPTNLNILFDRAKNIFKQLSATQDRNVLLHGDLHHENVMKNQDGLYLCFDPKGFVGDPSYEIATILNNPTNSPQITLDLSVFKNRVEYFSNSLNLPVSRIIGYFYVYLCLSIAWSIEDGCNYQQESQLLQLIYPSVSEFFNID
ncbi:MAG: fructosamine kinase family protein [Candidatus Cloacimonetes bacterium]|nr:fructosamine kinase family protein [Candidatus Cloacimonadota bacterium]